MFTVGVEKSKSPKVAVSTRTPSFRLFDSLTLNLFWLRLCQAGSIRRADYEDFRSPFGRERISLSKMACRMPEGS